MRSNLITLATAAAALLLPFAKAGDVHVVGTSSRHRSRARIVTKRTGPTNSMPAGWSLAAACLADAPAPNRLLAQSSNFMTTLTPTTCVANCNSKGFSYAAVQDGHECWCGAKLTPNSVAGKKANATECNFPCAGDAAQNCGGYYRVRRFILCKITSPWQPLLTQ